jgi:hypothetical protein
MLTTRTCARLVLLLGLLAASVPAAGGLPAALAQGQGCSFKLGFAALAAFIPEQVGSCLEDEAHNPENGDALQRTTGGLMVWRKADNWTAFTDGFQTWINGPTGLVRRLNTERCTWEGGSTLCGPTATGRTAQQGNVRLTYAPAVASNVTAATVSDFQLNPWPDPLPGIVRFTLQGYPTSGIFGPTVFVFPAQDYARRQPDAATRMDALRRLLSQRPALTSGLTVPVQPIPLVNASPLFAAKPRYAPSGAGNGVRFVTTFVQQVVPITARDLVYLYQGMSADGRYAIAAWLPVRANGQLPTPPTDFSDARIRAHNEAAVRALDALPNSAFTPNLDDLDALMAGLRID